MITTTTTLNFNCLYTFSIIARNDLLDMARRNYLDMLQYLPLCAAEAEQYTLFAILQAVLYPSLLSFSP